MPNVPFTGVPSVSPQFDPTPRYQADAHPESFGVNVGNAMQNLGKTIEGAGSEMFTRALAMQDLYNHSEAQEADAKYMQKAGDLHATYSSLQGKDAVVGYPKYISDLQDARKEIRGGLSNSMSQKLFDSQSLSTMGRTIFNGAGHAATENKKYALGSSSARVAAISDQTLSTPTDETSFKEGIAKAEAEVRAQGQLQGKSDDEINQAVATQRSELWSQRVKGLAKTQPFTAGKMLEQGVKDGDIRGEDIGKLTNIVQGARNTVGARQISHDVMSGAGLRWGQGQVDIKQAAEAIGQFESGGNYSTVGIQTSHGRALGKYQVMEEFLPEFLTKAGLPAMTKEEFLKSPSAQDQVFSSVFGGYMKDKGSFNDAASMWFSGKTVAESGGRKDALGTSVPAYLAATNAILAKNAPLSAKVAMGQKIATDSAPEDPVFGDYVTQRIEGDNNRQLQIKRDDEFNNRQVIETGLMGRDGGKLPSTLEELTADPKASDAWEHLPPSTQRRYLSVLARNAKGDHGWTNDTLRQYQQFKGQAQNDPAEFLDMDVVGTDLPNSAKRELINLQGRLKGKAENDPRVGRALGILAPDMHAAGIDRKADKEGYDQFTGALSDQLQQFAEENKRGPKIDEVRTIGSRLLQAKSVPGRLWGSNQYPTYQVPVPSDEAEKIKVDPTWQKLGIQPTEQQIQRIYTRKLYQELYGGTPKTQSPTVPVSQ